jgi:hypothetical protein
MGLIVSLIGNISLAYLPENANHNPGYHVKGYKRYALDYLPHWITTLTVTLKHYKGSNSIKWFVVLSAL